VKRQSPPASKASPGELSRGYLAQVRRIGTRLDVYKSMLYKPGLPYTQGLDEALLATESAAWRPGGTARGAARAAGLLDYIKGAEGKVRIISSNQVPMGGSSGQVPVSIQNGLHQAIRVRVVTSVENTPSRTSQLTVGRVPDPVVIQPQQPARPHQRGRDAAAVGRHQADRRVDQVRPGHLVPDRRGHRRPRAHLGIPGRPAVAARRQPSRRRRSGPTG
jgi:hypothetical protein